VCEKTYSRWCTRYFNYTAFNKKLITHEFPKGDEFIAVIDASFLRKSGKKTEGLGMFYCGSTGSAENGPEVSLISLVHLESNTGYALLYSTDTKLDAMALIRFYKARFQIEFIFRDAKQHTGLMDCQSCKKEAVNTHLREAEDKKLPFLVDGALPSGDFLSGNGIF
jgi:hypothetical protein